MNDKPKGIQEGPPIWVESLMTAAECRERYKNYPTSKRPDPIEYNPNYHSGGKWRDNMGSSLSKAEMDKLSREIDGLKAFNLKKKENERTI